MVDKLSNTVGRFMALIIIIVAAVSLIKPEAALWIKTEWINYLLMVVMFGMGITLKPEDFKVVFTRPKDIIIGFVAQFTLMPLIAFALASVFNLETGIMAGLILVGTCPGGTASNVMTYLAKGDVALSVGMTSVNTLMAPIMTPAITYLLLKTTVNVDIATMFLSIIKVVIVPILLGIIISKILGDRSVHVVKVMPLTSVIAIALILASVVSHNAEMIKTTGAIIFVVVILQNLLGYALGYLVGKATRMPLSKRKTLAIEIGMQNSGLASSLATTTFPNLAMATVPGAVYSIWHNVSGALLANIFKHMEEKK